MNTIYKDFLKRSYEVAGKVKNLTFLGDPILTTEAKFTSLENALVVCAELEKTLLQIRSIAGVGRGLAAPQIGSNEKCFVTFVDNQFQYFINPEIISSSSTKNWYRENCLSCGPLCCDLERPDTITLSFIDKDGNLRQEEFETFWARLIQHEYDHLQGVVNISKTKPEDLLQEKLRKNKDA